MTENEKKMEHKYLFNIQQKEVQKTFQVTNILYNKLLFGII